jgi:hypothetical protein
MVQRATILTPISGKQEIYLKYQDSMQYTMPRNGKTLPKKT